ncbi:hypothetical protein [Aeromicrobium sp. CTD01-1L150]|uniref:hypothetical protein n=1 Tax=Aeromicrobium sp. CTD01-1L150 TaxID=3341830 RepID=UPI0035BFFEC4
MSSVYSAHDPRSSLSHAQGTPRAMGDEVLPMQYFDFGALEPDVVFGAGSSSWVVRAQNIVLVLTDLRAGDTLERHDVDETMILVAESDEPVSLESGGQRQDVAATTIAIAPGGQPSRITSKGDARIVRLFATSAIDLVQASRNRALYDPAPDSVALCEPWPPPNDPGRLHVYDDLDSIPASPDRMGRIFRNCHAMMNVLYPRVGPRDPKSLSPHDHDDFEQLSLVLEGRYVHHIRAPWGKDRLQWRPDEHREIGTPSLAIIAPPLIHTSEAIGEGTNKMVDIFAGPRADFSAREGWVLNADDYPTPGWVRS